MREEPDLIQALQAAQIWDLVAGMPQGLDTVVGDRGHRLSGGEKQRLAIARVLLKAPAIVILDEATAHLDSESEVAVQRALAAALHGRTSLVIAHRLSTIRSADQILVIDGGRVVQSGTHAALIAEGGLYSELYRTQFEHQTADPALGVADAALPARSRGCGELAARNPVLIPSRTVPSARLPPAARELPRLAPPSRYSAPRRSHSALAGTGATRAPHGAT